MEIGVEVPLDPDGFLRRECPHCIGEFKWFLGRAEGTPEDWTDPEIYYCPYCGQPADTDSWHTQEQVDYFTQVALGSAREHVIDELRDATRTQRGSAIRFEVSDDESPPPAPLTEPPDQMAMIASPCHPFEPIKVTIDGGPVHCLVCGQAFTL